ncbi:MAG: hypothetical protein PUA77_01195 [Lachnospiraceae bacterium]|nr:hypothetical protein [Lachnospiraceae bacterium]
MQEMTRPFNDEKICRNLYTFMGEDVKEYMPHGVTENEFLERLNPGELETVQQNIVYSMIRRKTFDNAKVLKKWQVIVDATELDEGCQKKNEHYLSRCCNRREDNEYVKYHRSMLAAKIKKRLPEVMQKNISSELLASFGRQLTETEDIPAQLNNSVQN